jgi:DNA-binding MarR family transcriptional regulator
MDDMSTIPRPSGPGPEGQGCGLPEGGDRALRVSLEHKFDGFEQQAWRSFQRASARLWGLVAHAVSAHSDLSPADYVVLSALAAEPLGTVRLFELASCLGWEKSRLSHQVGRMASRGLVQKRRCPSDKRGTFVAVTSVGQEKLLAAAPAEAAAVRRLFAAKLSHGQLAALASACESLLVATEATTDEGHTRSHSPPAGGAS